MEPDNVYPIPCFLDLLLQPGGNPSPATGPDCGCAAMCPPSGETQVFHMPITNLRRSWRWMASTTHIGPSTHSPYLPCPVQPLSQAMGSDASVSTSPTQSWVPEPHAGSLSLGDTTETQRCPGPPRVVVPPLNRGKEGGNWCCPAGMGPVQHHGP